MVELSADMQFVLITVKDESGWWQGVASGVTGWFPANFVKELPYPSGPISSNYSSSSSTETSEGDDESVVDKLSGLESNSARLVR